MADIKFDEGEDWFIPVDKKVIRMVQASLGVDTGAATVPYQKHHTIVPCIFRPEVGKKIVFTDGKKEVVEVEVEAVTELHFFEDEEGILRSCNVDTDVHIDTIELARNNGMDFSQLMDLAEIQMEREVDLYILHWTELRY